MGSVSPIEVTIGGKIDDSNIFAITIERDMFQPDMAAIVLSNQENLYSGDANIKVGAEIEVKAAPPGGKLGTIYKGEVVGLEATYRAGEANRLLIRGMNKLHRLLRKRKSLTFTDKTDQQILSQVVGDAGLSLSWKHEKSITYKHVYQHNLTDLEFVRLRAGRMGCHVWCEGTDIFVKQPDLAKGPLKELKLVKSGNMQVKSFTPRLSSAAIMNKVTVKGWNPETKELITGVASFEGSRLGSQTAVAHSGPFGNEETFTVDHPIWSPDEANALAKARLQDLALSYITGECEVEGDHVYKPGEIVKITSNFESNASNDPFNGNYYLMGVTHRYTVPRNKDGGYSTILKLARNMAKQ